MTRTIRLTMALGLVAAGVGVGWAARPATAPTTMYDPQVDVTAATIAVSKAERVKKLADLTKYMTDRQSAGIARMQDVQRIKATLYQAKAEVAATDADKLSSLKVAYEAIKDAEVGMRQLAKSGVIGGPGQTTISSFVEMQLDFIDQTAELEIAIAKLEAKAK